VAAVLRWTAFVLVALGFGPLWYELVAQIYGGVFQGMPPSALFSVEQRHPEVLAACSIASLAVALVLHRRIVAARGIDTALVGGGFLLAGAIVVPPLWWLILIADGLRTDAAQIVSDPVATIYTPALLALSGVAWTALIVWAAWPLAALEVWLLGRLGRAPQRAGSSA
jgi:hypothetical protein